MTLIGPSTTIISVLMLIGVFALWASPALSAPADSPLPRIDWQEFEDLIREDPEIAVGEEMC